VKTKLIKNRVLLIGAIVGVAALVIGISFFFYGDSVQAMIGAVPPVSRLHLIGAGDSISKTLISEAGGNREASETINDPMEVIRGEDLTINITFLRSEDSRVKLKRLIERFPNPEYLELKSARLIFSAEGIDRAITSSTPLSSGQLFFNLNGYDIWLNAGQEVQFRIVLRAIQYTDNQTSDSIIIESVGSKLEYGDESISLPEAEVRIRDILGPKGDIYANGNINRSIADEKEGIDVIASENSIDNWFRNGVVWYLPNYTVKKANNPYYQTYQLLKQKATYRLKNEIAQNLSSANVLSQLEYNSDQPQVIYRNGNLTINRPIIVKGQKTVIVKGDLRINQNIEYLASDKNSAVAFLIERPSSIHITPGVSRVAGYYFTDLNCSSGDCQTNLNASGTVLRMSGAVITKRIVKQRPASFIYDNRGLQGFPGVEQLLNPGTQEISP